jgi:kynurenine 3-monooxygenase
LHAVVVVLVCIAEDVEELYEYLQRHGNDKATAIKEFSKHRAAESKTLVTISRDLDRPGIRGFVVFVLPIILDGIFSKLAPKLFAPNIITMLQKDKLTFQQVARRKRLDRLVQVSIIGSALASAAMAARFAVRMALHMMGV